MRNLDWSLIAVFLGGLSILFNSGYILIPKVIEKSKGYCDGLNIPFKMCTVLGFICVVF